MEIKRFYKNARSPSPRKVNLYYVYVSGNRLFNKLNITDDQESIF